MLQLQNILKIPNCINIQILIQLFGVNVKIYRPSEYNSIYSDMNPSSITYEETPIFEDSALIYPLSGKDLTNFNDISYLTEIAEDIKMFLPCDTEILPVNSLVIVENEQEQFLEFIILDRQEYYYNTNNIIGYYQLKPVFDKHKQFTDIEYDAEDLYDLEYVNKKDTNDLYDIDNYEIRDKESLSSIVTEIIDKEKEKQDTLLNKNRFNKFKIVNN